MKSSEIPLLQFAHLIMGAVGFLCCGGLVVDHKTRQKEEKEEEHKKWDRLT